MHQSTKLRKNTETTKLNFVFLIKNNLRTHSFIPQRGLRPPPSPTFPAIPRSSQALPICLPSGTDARIGERTGKERGQNGLRTGSHWCLTGVLFDIPAMRKAINIFCKITHFFAIILLAFHSLLPLAPNCIRMPPF